MDVERLKVTVEVFWLRLSGFVRTGIRAAGVVLVLLAVFNAFAPYVGAGAIAVYPRTSPVIVGDGKGVLFVEDVAAFTVGAVTAYFL